MLYLSTMAQSVPNPPQAKLCGFDSHGSPVFTRGAITLPKMCPCCGSKDVTVLVELTAVGNSRMMLGGVKYEMLTLSVPHCKPCSLLVADAHSKRAILIIPAVLLAFGVYSVTDSVTYAYLTFCVFAIAAGLIVRLTKKHGGPGASYECIRKDKMVFRAKNKTWLAELQRLNG
jgi:hypothetical protein